MLLAFALALPFAAYSVCASFEESRLERAHAGAEMLGRAQVTAALLDDHINDVRSILNVLTAVVSVDPARTADNDAFLRGLAGKIPAHINNITVWTAAGTNVGSLDPRLRDHGGVSLADRRFFKEAIASDGSTMSAEAPVVSLSNGSFVAVFGVPIRRAGRTTGVVAAAIRLGSLQDLLATGAKLPPDAVITVIDQGGIVLARSIEPARWVGRSVRGAASSGVPTGGIEADGVRDGPAADGVERLAGLTSARAAPWRVYVGVPKEAALRPVHERLRGNLFTATAVLLVGLLLATLVGEGIASPLRQLSDDAAHFGAGDLRHRSAVRTQGEIGVLVATLNRMAEQLEQRSAALQSSRHQLRSITDNLPALISYLDADERFTFANQVYGTWLGTDPDQLMGQSLLDLYGAGSYDGFKEHIRRALAGERVSYERELSTVQGLRRVEVTAIPDRAEDGRVKGLFVMMIDVTAHRQAQTALLQSERRLRMVADNVPAMITYVDRDERYRFVNAFLGEVFQTDPARLLGTTLRESGGEKLYAEIAPHVAAALGGQKVVFQGDWTVAGHTYAYQSTYVPDVDETGTVAGYYAMTFDISALKETQRRLDALARHDPLTGLPNRREFTDRLDAAMARCRRSREPMAMIFLDVDRFKQINDTWGHATGDAVLKEFARRLLGAVRSTDVVARLAGDEFVVVLEGLKASEEVSIVSEKLGTSIRQPMHCEGIELTVTASLGAAVYDGTGGTAEALAARADRALYRAKEAGRDTYAATNFTELV